MQRVKGGGEGLRSGLSARVKSFCIPKASSI